MIDFPSSCSPRASGIFLLRALSVPVHLTFAMEQRVQGQCCTSTFILSLSMIKTLCIYFASVKQQHAIILTECSLAATENTSANSFLSLSLCEKNIKLDYSSDRHDFCRRCCTAKKKHLSKCWEARSGVKEWEEIALTAEVNVLSGATAKMNWLNRWRSGWGSMITVIHGTCGCTVLSHWRQ